MTAKKFKTQDQTFVLLESDKYWENGIITIKAPGAEAIADGLVKMINQRQCAECGKFNGLHGEVFHVTDMDNGEVRGLARAEAILEGLTKKGFASCNIVFGIGSYTYQYVTRDTLGTAIKATWGQVDGEGRELFKKPKTDDGMKNSACGLIRVEYEHGDYVLYDRQTPEEEQKGCLTTVFKDGKIVLEYGIADIRKRLETQ